MKKLTNQELKARVAKNTEASKMRDEAYVPGLGYEVDLTKENCSSELWEALGGDGLELTEENYQRFLKGELI